MFMYKSGARSSKVNPANNTTQSQLNDIARMVTFQPVKEKQVIEQHERALRAAQAANFERERTAVDAVAERERKMLAQMSSLQVQLQEAHEEVERAQKAEGDLHKALKLAAERLSVATGAEGGLRSELDDTKTKLADAMMEVQHLRARLYGEKGLRLDKADQGGPPISMQKPNTDDQVIDALVTGAAPAAPQGGNPEERQSASRHAREQVKRLLSFVKKQLGEDLSQWRGYGDAPPAELTDQIAKQRALSGKLEGALHELMGNNGLPAVQRAHDKDSFKVTVAGASLPRTVAVNDSTVKPILLASGPATRWVLRPNDAPPMTPGTAAAKAAMGGEDAEENLNWQAGETLMMVVEAVDETGVVDDDFDATVLLEADQPIQGRGLVRITRGRGFVPLNTNLSGEILITLQDGGFTAMEQPPPIRVNFRGSAAAQIALIPEMNEAVAGDGVSVTIEARDRFNNIATDVTCEVILEASHGASWGDEPVKLEAGVAMITLVSEMAGNVELKCIEAVGAPEIDLEHGSSEPCKISFAAGAAACVQLAVVPNGPERVAGLRAKLLVEVADRYGNGVPAGTSNLAADLKIVPGPVGNASVERDGQCSIADGTGEVWVCSETAKEPTQFWLESSGAGGTVGGLTIRHSEDEPFEAMWTAGAVAQFGLYLPKPKPDPKKAEVVEEEKPKGEDGEEKPEEPKGTRVGGEKMVVGVRTEDAFGNPKGGFDGRVLVISHAKHVKFVNGAGKVQLRDGDGKLELTSDVAEPFQLSLQDIARHGLRTASVLRTTFRALDGVRAIFGDMGSAVQRVGFPYPLPLLVLDRLGNVADAFEGEVAVRMTGAARVAGRAPEIFRVVGGRATLPVLTTIAESVTFTLGDDAIIDKAAVEAQPALQGYPMTTTVDFVAMETNKLILTLSAAEGEQQFGREKPADIGDAPATDGVVARPHAGLEQVSAGTDVLVSIRAIDAYNNLVPAQQCTVFLEAELKPVYDEALTNINLQPASEPPQKYMLTLSGGEASQRVPTRVAGELKLQLKDASIPNLDLSSKAKLTVKAASACSIDVVNMPEAGRAGVEFQFFVRALDQFGNIDEAFEREVVLDSSGAPAGMELENEGRVQMLRGTGKSKCKLPGASKGPGPPPGAS